MSAEILDAFKLSVAAGAFDTTIEPRQALCDPERVLQGEREEEARHLL